MRKFYVAALVVALAPLGAQANTPPAQTAAPAPRYSTAETDLGTLLDNPATKAVLEKHLPQLVANERISMARGMTLRSIQPMAGDMLSDEALAKVDADLAKIPAK